MIHVTDQQIQDNLGIAIDSIRDGERLIVSHDGQDVAAIVSLEDLRFLQELEDREDIEDAHAALAEIDREGTIPLEEVLREYGIV